MRIQYTDKSEYLVGPNGNYLKVKPSKKSLDRLEKNVNNESVGKKHLKHLDKFVEKFGYQGLGKE